MSTGEYILQVTPKKVEFKQSTQYVKVTIALQFGELQYKSPYARFIRSHQGSFYGQRLKLHNFLNKQASFVVIAVGKMGEEVELTKIVVDIIELAEKQESVEKIFQNQQIKFEYQVLVFERELSDEDYEEIFSNKGSDKHVDSQPVLLNILSNDFEEKTILSDFNQKGSEFPQTPKLKQLDENNIQQLDLDHSPIVSRTFDEPESDNFVQIKSSSLPVRRSSLKKESTILLSPHHLKSNTSIRQSINGSRVSFTQSPKQPKIQKSSLSNYLLYTLVSAVSLYAGVWAKHTFNI